MTFTTASGLLPAGMAVYVQRGPNGVGLETRYSVGLQGFTSKRRTSEPNRERPAWEDGSSVDGHPKYLRTSSLGPLSSVPVTVTFGSEVPGIDFTIQTSIVVSVSGRVILDLPDVRFPYTARLQPTLLLHSFDPDPLNTEATRNAVRAVDTSNGQFEIRGVRPGPYELVISVPGGCRPQI